MNLTEQKRALACAVKAARAVGKLMRANLNKTKRVNSTTQHDIKLELDVRSQKLIAKTLASAFPRIALIGEEGITGDPESAERWVVDPIDGTVNFTYGIPHACISIALQARHLPITPKASASKHSAPPERKSVVPQEKSVSHEEDYQTLPGGEYQTLAGVVYDPFCDELWTAILGQPARLNGKIIHVSQRPSLREAIVAIGFAKSRSSLETTLPYFNQLVRRVRKVRMTGSAALAMVYVASGRFDAYIEQGIRLWDIAAGGLIVECAGGEFWRTPIKGEYTYHMITSNGLLRKKLEAIQ